jgi:hypothetical protein
MTSRFTEVWARQAQQKATVNATVKVLRICPLGDAVISSQRSLERRLRSSHNMPPRVVFHHRCDRQLRVDTVEKVATKFFVLSKSINVPEMALQARYLIRRCEGKSQWERFQRALQSRPPHYPRDPKNIQHELPER